MEKRDAALLASGALLGAAAVSLLKRRRPSPSLATPLPVVSADSIGLVLGTMTMGGQTSSDEAARMVSWVLQQENGDVELDTARMYEHGETEVVLGRLLAALNSVDRKRIHIASKVNPFRPFDKSLSKDSVLEQYRKISKSLGTEYIDTLYLHAPDGNTPILETLEAVQQLYVEKRFRRFGLSNYQSWEVVWIHRLCQERGWVVPRVYQGMYNAITRDVERELLPALRKLNMAFYAYNPLAGGLLTGKHSKKTIKVQDEGRFKLSNTMYRDRFCKRVQIEAMEKLGRVCQKNGILLAEASLRWIMNHSKLQNKYGDRVVLGASCMEHLTMNMAACAQGELPRAMVEAFHHAWMRIEQAGACPRYDRGCSKA